MRTVPMQGRVHLTIVGRVQGVYFRASTVQEALRLGITGWVKNRRDGSVEILAEGAWQKLDELVAWCHQGPPGARVEKVDLKRQEFLAEFADFHIRRSYE